MTFTDAPQRVASGGTWRTDAGGRHRYRGQGRRGQRRAHLQDAADLRFVIRELLAVHDLLELGRVAVPPSAASREHRQLRKELFAKIGLAGRMLDEILDRGPA